MKTLLIIPARYASTRFPGKPLALLGGKPIIQHVWNRLEGRVEADCIVATDDETIADAVEGFGGEVMLTADTHRSGTDRCGETLERVERVAREVYDVVVNVQGDEPFVEPAQVHTLIEAFADPNVQIATLATPIADEAELQSPDNVKVVVDQQGNALYFSRAAIPYRRDAANGTWAAQGGYLKHVGIYAFRSQVLREVCQLPQGELEQAEKLEQLRWLAAGYRIAVRLTDHATIGIDTPNDLKAAEKYLKHTKR